MEETETYRLFLNEYAPLGYARLYQSKGDFYRAQQALERALVEGYKHWSSHHIPVRDRAKLMTRIVDGYGLTGAPPSEGEGGPESSFSRSPKLRAIDEAVTILKSFKPDEQAALFLLHVEEVPEERAAAWLEVDAHFMKDVQARLAEKLTAWKPPVAAEETPAEFFFRALRQYRLSSSFIPTVVSRLQVKSVSGDTASRSTGCAIAAIAPIILVIGILYAANQRGNSFNSRSTRDMLAFLYLPMGNLALDVIVAMAALLTRRFLEEQAPASLARGPAGSYPNLLLLGAIAGFIFVVIGLAALFAPAEIFREPDTLYWYFILHQGWLLGCTLLVLMAAYHVVTFYMKRLDAAAPRDRGTP